MKFGLFGSAQTRRGGPDVDSGMGFREWTDYVVEAEALGFHSIFTVEHHFTGFGQVSASLNLLTWVAARTQRIRLGTAVLVLPWHDPVLLAEQAATLDLLSGGRLDFGVGKGYRYNEFASFRIPMEEAEARFEESLAIITRAWTSEERFSFDGKFWSYSDIVVEPPPAQRPHPPFWMGAGSPASIRRVAERGCKLLLDQFAPHEAIGERVALFRAEVEARGRRFDPMDVAGARADPDGRQQGQHHGLFRHARCERGERALRHAGRDHRRHPQARGARRALPAAERGRDVARQSAPLRPRGDAGLRGKPRRPAHCRVMARRDSGGVLPGRPRAPHSGE
jgi:probable F420-dependent oxidoreductase